MDKIQHHQDICKELHDIYLKKNADYGDSFRNLFKECGMVYAYGHLKEKLNRVKSLMRDENKVKGESMRDSLIDLANYAILTAIEVNKQAREMDKNDKVEPRKLHRHQTYCNSIHSIYMVLGSGLASSYDGIYTKRVMRFAYSVLLNIMDDIRPLIFKPIEDQHVIMHLYDNLQHLSFYTIMTIVELDAQKEAEQ